MQLSRFTVLSEPDIREIHEATLDILEHCGVKILHRGMLSFLKEKGLAVDEQTQVVRFSRGCVADAMGLIPPQFEVFDRQGRFAFVIGDRVPKIAAGHNAVFWVDSKTGQTRYSTVADVELFARLCQHLEGIDIIGIPVMPQDIPNPSATMLYGLKAVIENSTKPVYFSADTAKVNQSCLAMLRAAFVGDLQSRVYGIAQCSPTSPLFWEEQVIESIMQTAPTGVPLAILPEPNAGVSAPYTLAGLLTVNNVECLSGLVMIQLLRPGAKVMYANSWTTMDMRSGAALVASAETNVCRIAAAQLAHFYCVPSHTTAPNSDNHAHDEQNAWEKTFSQFCAIGAGHDLIVNCGMFATGMTCSHEQLLMDEEISNLSRRIAAGVEVNHDTISKDLIKAIGPQRAEYLTADHTLRWLHSPEHLEPNLSVRGPRACWEAKGAKDTYLLAKDKVDEYGRLPLEALDRQRSGRLRDILRSFEA